MFYYTVKNKEDTAHYLAKAESPEHAIKLVEDATGYTDLVAEVVDKIKE